MAETFDPATVARRGAKLLCNNILEGAQLGEVLGLVGQTLRINPRATPRVNLTDSVTDLQFFVTTVDFAIIPRARRHPQSALIVI